MSNDVAQQNRFLPGCDTFQDGFGDISKWDTSKVTDMRGMFKDASTFERDLSKWDLSSLKNPSPIQFRLQFASWWEWFLWNLGFAEL